MATHHDVERLIEAARSRPRAMTESERDEQRVNFAYGNAPESDTRSTKESVIAASKILDAA